jgi:hypothetical protein
MELLHHPGPAETFSRVAAVSGDELAATQNVQVKIKAGEDLMHEKDFAVDGNLLRTGSANWSFGGLRRHDNITVYTQGPLDAAAKIGRC